MSNYLKLNPNREFSEYSPRTPESIKAEKRIKIIYESATKSNSTLSKNDDDSETIIS
jgi:hypothetical protein